MNWHWMVIGGVAGGVAGALMRLLLGRLRRGTQVPGVALEVATGLLTAVGAGLTVPRLGVAALPVCWLGIWGLALAVVDIKHHRLPDALTVPGAVISVGAVAVATPGRIGIALLAGVVGAAALALPALLAPASMGWGDVKLMFSLGALTGAISWSALVLTICGGFVLAAVVALGGMAVRAITLRSAIAFGPFLIAAAYAVLLVAGAGWVPSLG